MDNTREKIAVELIKFACQHELKIHPEQDPFRWADLVIKKDGCLCIPGRKHCPCEFALDDIKKLGCCRCGLFCNDDYIKEYNDLRANLKGSRK